MVRTRKGFVTNRNISNISNDPKFQCKCYVNLENCDFSNFRTGLPVMNNVAPGEKIYNKRLDCVDQPNNLNQYCVDSVKKKQREKLQFKLPDSKTNSMKHIERPVESNDGSKKNSDEKVVPVPKKLLKIKHENDYNGESVVGPKKWLRDNKKIDYKELSPIGTPDRIICTQDNRIPIYKKVIHDSPKRRKRRGDMYDFFPDSDDEKDSDVSFTLPLKKTRNIHKLKFNIPRNNIKSKKAAEIGSYQDKINDIIVKLIPKIKSPRGHNITLVENKNSKTNNERKDQKTIYQNSNEHAVFNSTMLPDHKNVMISNESIINNEVEISVLIERTKERALPASENSSYNTGHDSYSNLSSDSIGGMSIRSFSKEIDNSFGFCDEGGQQQELRPRTRIKILENMVLNSSVPAEQYMSTPKRHNKSWRFDTDMNRNPHYIYLKKNSLPSLNQDPVLDHTFDERINQKNKVILDSSAKKSPKQQSILDFVESVRDYPENTNCSRSLFDIDKLSPIRKDKNADKENSGEKKIATSENKRVKKNILGEISDSNRYIVSSPKAKGDLFGAKTNPLSSHDESLEVPGSFGFSSSPSGMLEGKDLEEPARPFRMEVPCKKYNKINLLSKKINQPVRDSEVKRLVLDDPGFDVVVDRDGLDCGNWGLFEDIQKPEEPMETHTYHKKKKIDQETNKCKPKEVKMSKEAQQWIEKFNQMVDEVEHEELDIE